MSPVKQQVRDARERPFRVCDNNAPDSVEDLELLGQPDRQGGSAQGQDVERGRYNNSVRGPHRSDERRFVRMRVQQDDVAVVTNIREHLIELLLRWQLVIEAPMRDHRSDPKWVIDEGFPERDAPMKDVNDGNAAFGPLQRVAQSAGGIEIDGDDLETTSRSGSAERIAAGCLSDTTF